LSLPAELAAVAAGDLRVLFSSTGQGSMGLTQARDPEAVLENRRRLLAAAGRAPASLTAIGAVHGTDVGRVDSPSALVRGVDGLVTTSLDVTLFATFADCYPLVLFDPSRRALALGHAGWRGTQGGIAKRLMEKLNEEFGSLPSDTRAIIGPGICGGCYEVGPEFQGRFAPEVLRRGGDDRLLLDLREANRLQLLAAGIPQAAITHIDTCTFESDQLFSHRRRADGSRFAAIAFIS
jgi:YfiH family protein